MRDYNASHKIVYVLEKKTAHKLIILTPSVQLFDYVVQQRNCILPVKSAQKSKRFDSGGPGLTHKFINKLVK